MIKWLAATALLAAAALSAPAQWYVGGSAAYFNWSEASVATPVVEHGLLLGLEGGYMQTAERGLLFAYRGRLYGGTSQYLGFAFFDPQTPASGATGYVGTMQELQGRYRFENRFDVVAALGGDFWRRTLNARQTEKYSVVYAALGAEYNGASPGVTAGARLSLPVWAQLDANFNALGFDQDPAITLGKTLGGSATLGYRFARLWALIGFADVLRFSASPERVVTRDGSVPMGVFQSATSSYVVGLRAEFTR